MNEPGYERATFDKDTQNPSYKERDHPTMGESGLPILAEMRRPS